MNFSKKVYFVFFLLFVCCKTESDSGRNVTENPPTNTFPTISKFSSDENILNAVRKLGNGNLSIGIDKVLKGIKNVVDNEINHLDETLSHLGIKNIDEFVEPIVEAIKEATGININRKDAAKTIMTLTLQATSQFLDNTTRALLQNMEIFDQLSTAISSGVLSLDPDVLLVVNLILLDDIYTTFEDYDKIIANNLQQLVNVKSSNLIETSVTVVVNLIKESNNLWIDYAATVQKELKSISEATAGTYQADSVKETITNLKSIKNRDKITTEVDLIIKEIQLTIGNIDYTVCDVSDTLKQQRNLKKLFEVIRKLVLQFGLGFLKGVNDVSKTDALENVAKNVNNIDHSEINKGLATVMKDVSDLWKPSLANILKEEIQVIDNPSIDELLQIIVDYFYNAGKQLTVIINDVESRVNKLVKDSKETNRKKNSTETSTTKVY